MNRPINLEAVANKLTVVAKNIKADKGPLVLFGLFQRDNSLENLWDVVIAAPWLNTHDIESFQYVDDRLREVSTDDERLAFSRMVLLGSDDAPVVNSILERFKGLTGRLVDVYHQTEGGALIRGAYIIVPGKAPDRQPRRKTKRQSQPK
jgi:polyphosphate kinase